MARPQKPGTRPFSGQVPADVPDWYAARAGSARAGMSAALEAWPAVVRRELEWIRTGEVFSRAEAEAVARALIGSRIEGRTAGLPIPEDLLGVAGGRINQLSPAQRYAVEWWAAWAWRGVDKPAEWDRRVGELVGGGK